LGGRAQLIELTSIGFKELEIDLTYFFFSPLLFSGMCRERTTVQFIRIGMTWTDSRR
jgi:hypothetical protein